MLAQDDWLTLSDVVAWQCQRQNAAHGLRHLSGVTGINNQIAIKPAATIGRSDIEATLNGLAAADQGL